MFHFLISANDELIDVSAFPQAVSTQGGAGQPTQTQNVGLVQRGLWCHYVLLRTLIKALHKDEEVLLNK